MKEPSLFHQAGQLLIFHDPLTWGMEPHVEAATPHIEPSGLGVSPRMRTEAVRAEPALFDIRGQIENSHGVLLQFSQHLHLVDCRVVAEQAVSFLSDLLWDGLVFPQFLEKCAGLQEIPCAFVGRCHGELISTG